MKHLIIGAGNMGKRYQSILHSLGHKVDMVDLEYDGYPNKHYDSVLICTSASTHIQILNTIPSLIPVFIEKPLIVHPDTKIENRNLSRKSLVSTNWYFCPHLNKAKEIDLKLSYPSTCPYRAWDIIHFLHYMSLKRPQIALELESWVKSIKASFNSKDRATIKFEPNKLSILNGQEIHKDQCIMFKRQMQHWIKVLKDEEESIMPIAKSLPLHIQLAHALQANNAVKIGI